MIPLIKPGKPFPPVEYALEEPNGLLAFSERLYPDDILRAYKKGIFPWNHPSEPIIWWSPDPRSVLYPKDFRLHRSLKKRIRTGDYRICIDQHFEQVINGCASPRKDSDSSWISDQFIRAYTELHQRGIAHSIEIFSDNQLVGGLYGLSMGHIFFGESMFSRSTDASKIALAFLCFVFKHYENSLIDCQIGNPHLASLGATEIPRADFAKALSDGFQYPSPSWTLLESAVALFHQQPNGLWDHPTFIPLFRDEPSIATKNG